MDLADGQTYEMQGSGKTPYQIKNVGGVYSCTCPAWRNQSVPINVRTCKHIRKLRGDAAEEARIRTAEPLKPLKPEGSEDTELPVLLAHVWSEEHDPVGWWMSEKLDGVRAYWDGKQFLSRKNNVFYAPDWFTAGLPDHPLDGELWIARGAFDRTSGIVRSQGTPDRWKEMLYVIFDAPEVKGPFEDRMKYLEESIGRWKARYAALHAHERCAGVDHMLAELERVTQLGGEGVMLRKPGSTYERTRSTTLLKVKKFLDAEAVVTGYQAGKGRHKGRVGALVARFGTGVEFEVGTGLKDRDRDSPPAVGAVVTVKYQELTKDGKPRFPVFVGGRTDGDPNAPPPTRKKSKANEEAEHTPARAPAAVAACSPTPVPTGGPTMATMTKRYFEFVDGSSSKFWEVWLDGTDVVTQWGKIGTPGRETRKPFADAARAQKEYDKLVAEKTGKGYVETPRAA